MADDALPSLTELRARVGDLAVFVASIGRLLRRILTDRRVPRSAKLVVLGAAGYVASPIDLIPDFLPAIGLLDDLWLVRHALRYLFQRAGHDVVREHWDGTDEGFAALLYLAGISR